MTSSAHLPLRIVVLASGSAGNATAITDGTTTLLVDCGLSAREIARRLEGASVDPASVSALLLTHEHGDHVRGVDVFVRRHAAPGCVVAGSRGTLVTAALEHLTFETLRLSCGSPVRFGTLEVLPFATSHDCAQPLGYRIESDGVSVGIATDTGVLTDQAAEALAGCDVLGIEANHDVRMLENGPYPYHLKRRIRSDAGHLSNHDAADALERLASNRLRAVFALHRSRTNNTANLAASALETRVKRLGLAIPVTVAAQDAVCDSDPPQQRLFVAED